jgi:peptidyl-prolyl cis-trans isomerase A (cyclophilin A)/peptidyl-prolyl cis-trans isomerase B (cyclophilin B)
MCKLIFVLIMVFVSSSLVFAEGPKVSLTTSKGIIIIELDDAKAPISTQNFLTYVKEGFYDGTVFHRVIKGFMIQGGGMDEAMNPKRGHGPIKNEADNGLKNDKYTVAMARTGEINSATAQFFINTGDNAFLNHGARDFGYAVFGKVVAGKRVVDLIEAVPTGSKGMHGDVPLESIMIEKAEVME